MDAISEQINAEQEPIWRNITYAAMSKLSPPTKPEELEWEYMRTAKQIADTLAPIVEPSSKSVFEARLVQIVRDASDVWTAVKMDRLRISLSEQPPSNASPGQSWQSASLSPELRSPPDTPPPVSGAKSLCLFPVVKARSNETAKEGDIIVHDGYALFADSPVFALGLGEQQDYAIEEAEAMCQLRRRSTTSQATTVVSDLSPRSKTSDMAAALAEKKAVVALS